MTQSTTQVHGNPPVQGWQWTNNSLAGMLIMTGHLESKIFKEVLHVFQALRRCCRKGKIRLKSGAKLPENVKVCVRTWTTRPSTAGGDGRV